MPPVTEASARPLGDAEFAALMGSLGPFGAAPRLGVACSGGADSTALAMLASRWAGERGGSVLALAVDHGLRRESGTEAALTLRRLAERGVPGRLLALDGLCHGSGLAERARLARYAALLHACRDAGIAHLLLGHQAADQGETVIMRRLGGSGPAGLAGMSAIGEREDIRLLRPLLGICPDRLRETLRTRGVEWIDDPSNRDPSAFRARLRASSNFLSEAAAGHGRSRAGRECAIARTLAERVAIRPEGFAVISPGPLPAAALAALIQAISGSRYAPSPRQVEPLAAAPLAATLGGARLLPAGRMGPGVLMTRESAAQSGPVPAHPGMRWDGRFRLALGATPPLGATLGALGAAAAHLRHRSSLPSAVLHALPALWLGETLFAVPHIEFPDAATCRKLPVDFCPRRPATAGPWCIAAGPD